MALNNRSNIIYQKASDGKYKVYSNTIAECYSNGTAYPSKTYNFASNYQINCYEINEVDNASGVIITSTGVLQCSEFIEGEPS